MQGRQAQASDGRLALGEGTGRSMQGSGKTVGQKARASEARRDSKKGSDSGVLHEVQQGVRTCAARRSGGAEAGRGAQSKQRRSGSLSSQTGQAGWARKVEEGEPLTRGKRAQRSQCLFDREVGVSHRKYGSMDRCGDVKKRQRKPTQPAEAGATAGGPQRQQRQHRQVGEQKRGRSSSARRSKRRPRRWGTGSACSA